MVLKLKDGTSRNGSGRRKERGRRSGCPRKGFGSCRGADSRVGEALSFLSGLWPGRKTSTVGTVIRINLSIFKIILDVAYFYAIILSLTAKVRRLPLFRRSTGFFGHAKCSYILLLFCLGCLYDFSHIYIRYDLLIRTETGRFVERIRQIGSCVNRRVS